MLHLLAFFHRKWNRAILTTCQTTKDVCGTIQNTGISPNFLVWNFCGKAQFLQSFGQFAWNSAFPQNLHTRKLGKISVLEWSFRLDEAWAGKISANQRSISANQARVGEILSQIHKFMQLFGRLLSVVIYAISKYNRCWIRFERHIFFFVNSKQEWSQNYSLLYIQ